MTFVQLLLVPCLLCEQLITMFRQLDAIQLEHPPVAMFRLAVMQLLLLLQTPACKVDDKTYWWESGRPLTMQDPSMARILL